MTLLQATAAAKRFSIKYGTFWYVRKVSDSDYQPWAHNTDETCRAFFAGNLVG